jgi:hypothetical protein
MIKDEFGPIAILQSLRLSNTTSIAPASAAGLTPLREPDRPDEEP